MTKRERSYELIIENKDTIIKELKAKIKQLEMINHDALLRNVEMANELREYQKQKQYKESNKWKIGQ